MGNEVFLSTVDNAKQVSRLNKNGLVRKIIKNLYTENMTDSLEDIVRRNLWNIVGLLYPNAIVGDRTAWELKPNADGEVFLIVTKKLSHFELAPFKIFPRMGNAPLSSDIPFMQSLFLPSNARKFLECAQPIKRKNSVQNRYFTQEELEDNLEKHLSKYGESALNKLRDEMRNIAPRLNLADEFNKINSIISALLQTHKMKLTSNRAIARQSGEPFDENRIALFTKLYRELESTAPVFRKTDQNKSNVLCFYESYFSNYIEGTKFLVDEAREIVFENKIPEKRPEDAHDIYETYKLITNSHEMSTTPESFEELTALMKSRHKFLMKSRNEINPGEFKDNPNQAGSTVFVKPELVQGTLKEGFRLYSKLENPFSKAVFMMFMVAEVHPFNDGNGRIARIMMNAELVKHNEQRIIIPTVYRYNYLQSLKALSQTGDPEPYVKTIDFVQRYCLKIDWQDFNTARTMLTRTNAFIEDDDSKVLRLP